MPLSLTLCGRVGVMCDGVSPAGPPLAAKSIALLGYLALEPGPHSREHLTALLWGEYPEAKARASLRQALTHLREALPGVIQADRASIRLAAPVECDVLTFQRLAKESPRAAAESAVSGFLDGLHLRHCPAFDEWADRTRANLVKRLGEVLSATTREAVATGQWGDAVRFAKRWVAAAPLSASANTALMEGYFMGDDRVSALDAFTAYRALLTAETGREPERSVAELADRIRSAALASARRSATEEWYAAAPSFHGSLIGRSQEWDQLVRALRKTTGGAAGVVLVEGDAGVGKTRLALDFLRWVAAEGGTVLHGRGYDVRGGVPFGAVIEALRSAIEAPGLAGTESQWLAQVARVVPELRGRFPAIGEPGPGTTADGWRLLEGIAQILIALTEEAPVTVLIDDLQWCDADSCTLLHSLIRRLEATPVLWCLTFSPGAVERDAPAARLVRALRTFRHAEVVTLRPLQEDEVWQLVRGLGRVSTPTGARRLAARLHEATAGYPFYVIELLKTLFAQGWLTVDPGTSEWIVRAHDSSDGPAFTLAPSVHEAIAERIECLPDDVRAVLITIAVSARGCRADVLSHMHGISRLRAAAVGDSLVERHLALEEDGAYRCAHPIIARVVSDRLGAARRREVHRALAVSLELTAGNRLTDAGEIARHAEQGGERVMAYRYAMLAAEACEARFAHGEALTWLDFAAGLTDSQAEAEAVNLTTARLLDLAGRRDVPRYERTPTPVGQLAAADFDL